MAHYDPGEFEMPGGRPDNVGDRLEDETIFTTVPIPRNEADHDTLPDVPIEHVGERGRQLGPLKQAMEVHKAVDRYYAELKAAGEEPPEVKDYDQFYLDKSLKLRLYKAPSVDLVGKRGQALALTKHSREALDLLGLKQRHTGSLSKQAVAALTEVRQAAADAENIELQDLPQAAERVSQAIHTLSGAGVQTDGLPLRELEALDMRARAIRGQLTIALSKKIAFQQEADHRRQKVAEALDEENRRFEEAKLQEALEGVAFHDERIRELQGKMQNEFVRIKESIFKFLHEDTTLGERIRTLFKEQGVTIVSIITALGMAISTLVLAITGGTSSALPPPSPRPTPPDKGGIKEWAKQRLQDLGRLLGKLAEKAAAALPGIIGSIVSWLLSTAQKAVGWLAENLWALMVGIGGMLYLTARDYMTLRLATSRAPPKKE